MLTTEALGGSSLESGVLDRFEIVGVFLLAANSSSSDATFSFDEERLDSRLGGDWVRCGEPVDGWRRCVSLVLAFASES